MRWVCYAPEKVNEKLEPGEFVALVPLLHEPTPEFEDTSVQAEGGSYSIRGSLGDTLTVLIVLVSDPSSLVWPASSLERLWMLCWLGEK